MDDKLPALPMNVRKSRRVCLIVSVKFSNCQSFFFPKTAHLKASKAVFWSFSNRIDGFSLFILQFRLCCSSFDGRWKFVSKLLVQLLAFCFRCILEFMSVFPVQYLFMYSLKNKFNFRNKLRSVWLFICGRRRLIVGNLVWSRLCNIGTQINEITG